MIGADTTVFAWVHHPPYSGQRAWIARYETARNNLGELVIVPYLDDDPSAAMSLPYQAALILKRRLEGEGVISSLYQVRFSLNPTGDEVGAGHTTSAPTEDRRVVTVIRGLLARPGISVNHGRCWYVRFPGQSIESVRGSTPEEAAGIVFDRKLEHLAEQAPPPPPAPPEPPATKKHGARTRPGDLR